MIKLGEKIRNLRRERGISQETLAEHLGVSFQAVSKWETAVTMPDVTMIPAIASFFGVSTDELFDFNLYEIEKSVEAIVDEHSKCWDDPVKCEAILREGLKKYPGNDILLNCLIGVIPVPDRADEVIGLCRALIAVTRHDDVRIDAYRIMAEAYHSIDEQAMAKEALEQIPEVYFTKLEMAARLLDGEESFEAAAKQRGLSFDKLVTMCRIMARHYEARGEYRRALIQLEMAKNFLLSAKDDEPTAYTRSLFAAYSEQLEPIEADIMRVNDLLL